MSGMIIVMLYVVVSAFICNWIMDNIFKRCEDPFYQVQSYNPIIFILCATFGWLVVVPLLSPILLLALMNKFSLDEAFKIMAKKLDDRE